MKKEKLNLVLADDDADDCLLFNEALEELPFSASLNVVHDGEQLMRFLLKNTDNLPHVLFLDLNMPRKNGSQCLAEIKKNPKLNSINVIIFSTSFDEDVVNLLRQQGAR